ncbi:hypothetical protein ACFLWU_00070 [Chloroflexota bacterium]
MSASSKEGYIHTCEAIFEIVSFQVEEGKVMTAVLTYSREASIGIRARRLRISEFLTRQQLAALSGVSVQEVGIFERNLPLQLDSRRKILKALWTEKTRKR